MNAFFNTIHLGGELFEYILAHRYLKEKDAKRFFAQLISSVQYMHKRKIVHRDLKLENLLLDKNRNIVVTDFGFANQFSSAADDLMATTCGSPCYAAPELVVNAGLYAGSAVDIWSCGVILYAMLCGFLPFDDDPANPDSDNINQLYRYILSTHLMFPSYVSIDARDLLEKMLVPDPVKRCSLDYIIQHPWLQTYREFLRKDSARLEMEPTSLLLTADKVHEVDLPLKKPNIFNLTNSVSTTVQSTSPKKVISSKAATRKTHIPVVSHDRFAPVANDKYLIASNKKRDNANANDTVNSGRTGAFRHFSIGRSSATTTTVEKPSVHATVTPTKTSKVPNFISRKPVKKEGETNNDATDNDLPPDLNPEKSLSSPLLVQDSKIPTVSAFGSIRKNRGTDKFLSFFTGGRASHIPVVVKSEERRLSFSLDNQKQDAVNNIETVVDSKLHDDTDEQFHSTIDDSNEHVSAHKNEDEEENSDMVHSNSETSTIGNSTPSLHVERSSNLSNVSTPLSPTPLAHQPSNPALASDSVLIETSNPITISNEEPQSPTVGSINQITPSTAVVSEVILEEDETTAESPGDQEASFSTSELQQPNAGSSIGTASVLSDNGGSLSINSSIVSFKDTPRRTPLLFASQKGGNSSFIMRQQQHQYFNQQNQRPSLDNGSSILSNERQQDTSSISSAGTGPQPEVSSSTRLNTAKIMGDGGRKAMAAVRRSIYRKHKSQPPPPKTGPLSDTSSRDSSVRLTSTREPLISFSKSRFEETGTQVTQVDDIKQSDHTNNRNTWSSSTLISSASELTENREPTFRSNTIINRNQSTVTSNAAGQPPKKAGKKMMDWIKKKSQAKETKKEPTSTEQTESHKSSSRLTTSNQLLTKSRRISARNDTPTSTAAAPTLKTNVTKDIKKITTASNKKASNGVTSILATSTKTTRNVSILPSPAPSPTPPSPQPTQEQKKETIDIPEFGKSKRTVRALSGNEASLAASLKKADTVDERIQYHQGAVDRTALTSQSPAQVIKDIARILRILGIDSRAEASNPFILKCCRRKARAFLAAEALKNNEEDDHIYTNESAITSTSEVSLLAPSSKDGQSLSSYPSSDPMSDSRGLEPIYGDASIDNGDEIRFAVEICRFRNLPGLYIVDIKRSKGNVWAYKFLYHKLIDFLNLEKNGVTGDHLAAYLLLVAGGNTSPSAEDLKTLLGSVGVEAESDRVAALIKSLEGKTVQEAIAEGSSKLASVSAGGAAAASSGAAAASGSDAPAEEAKEEEKEESDDDMGFGLFD
ncbi:unnamed protein product [Mucor hiemalis]